MIFRSPHGAAITLAIMLSLTLPAFSQTNGLPVGTVAPDFTLSTLDDTSYHLQDFRGKAIVVLDFSRMACFPCQAMIRDLQKLSVQYQGRPVRFFNICLDGEDAPYTIPPAIHDLKFTYPVLVDRDLKVRDQYHVFIVPHLVLVDLQGVVRYTHTGHPEGTLQRVTEQIERYLPAQPAGQ